MLLNRSTSEVKRAVDLFQAFIRRCVLLERIPSPSHRHSKIELSIASVFHSGSVRLKCWWMTLWCSHHDDKIQGVPVPAGEQVVGPGASGSQNENIGRLALNVEVVSDVICPWRWVGKRVLGCR
jgi:hypothetical protein